MIDGSGIIETKLNIADLVGGFFVVQNFSCNDEWSIPLTE